MAMPPTNTLDTVNWMGMVKLPGRTTANASFTMGANRQDEALIPWTTNPVIANPTVYASFPDLAALPRDTAADEGELRDRHHERELAADTSTSR